MLITFLGMPAYEAVGIALASDVLASAVSAYTYGKNKNLDIKNGFVMMIAVLIFTFIGENCCRNKRLYHDFYCSGRRGQSFHDWWNASAFVVGLLHCFHAAVGTHCCQICE